ncbi:MAG: hypothetical protein Q8L14_25450 [Myxococcales bacterium]|nr:hypothetical protein [Myxococcales bacterium]
MLKKVLLFLLLSASCRATSGLTGTWTGRLESPDKVGVRFVLEEDAGTITGRVYWEDPKTLVFEPEGTLVGVSDGGTVSWRSESDVTVVGTVRDTVLEGTLTFPVDEEALPGTPLSARITLTR